MLPIWKPDWPERPLRPHPAGELFILSVPFTSRFRIEAPERASGVGRTRSHTALKKAFFLGVNLLGDLLCTTPAVRAYRQANPDAFITYIVHNATYCRVLDGNPDIDLVLYSERLYLEGEQVLCDQSWFQTLPMDLDGPSDLYRFNIHEVCRSDPNIFQDNIAVAFSRFIDIPIDSVRPVVCVSPEEKRLAASYTFGGRYLVLSMHSTTKVVGESGKLVVKDWPAENWLELAQRLQETLGLDIVALGAESDKCLSSPYIRNLYGLPIKVVAALLQDAACVVTVENGLMHLCHAVDAPMVVIFSKFVPFAWSNPSEASRARVLYEDPVAISSCAVAAAVKAVVEQDGWRE